MLKTKNFHFAASKSSGEVTGILMIPVKTEKLLVFAHGAGAGMMNSFMEKMSEQLAGNGIATFRYNLQAKFVNP